jgi:5-formyltetrahydrofolate cyclo-ligase
MPTTTKSQWRSRLRSARRSMDDAARHLAAEQLASAGAGWATQLRGSDSPGTVCAYISSGSEPGTGPLLRSLHQAGHGVYVPVCEPGHQLSWTQWTPGVALERSLLAPVMEPAGQRLSFATLGAVDGILLPALAVDITGVRLGQGGGYYDRFLASLACLTEDEGHAVPTAAVVHVQEVFEEGLLPHNELDRRVDWVVTPGGWSRTAPTSL